MVERAADGAYRQVKGYREPASGIRFVRRGSRLDGFELGWGDRCRITDVVGLEPEAVASGDDSACDVPRGARPARVLHMA